MERGCAELREGRTEEKEEEDEEKEEEEMIKGSGADSCMNEAVRSARSTSACARCRSAV